MGIALPFGHHHSVFRLCGYMFRVGVYHNHFRKVAVKIRQVLHYFAVDGASGFTVQAVGDVEVELVEFVKNGFGSEGMLSREDNDLVELRYVSEEVVYARPFGGPPAILALK